jgi:hypothetical protein
MTNYIEMQNYKIISNYGGIGSIIETLSGALLISSFERWPFYIEVIRECDELTIIDKYALNDFRLLKRLQHSFHTLAHLIKVPVNCVSGGGYKVENPKNLISAEFFPKWFFCPNCYRFNKIHDWIDIWKTINPDKAHNDSNFIYCPNCFKTSNKRKRRFVQLEQVRFIQISDNGDIQDFPWQEWFDQKYEGHSCDKHTFTYKTSPRSDNLNAIHIECSKCKNHSSLGGIFGFSQNEDTFITVIRSSNNVYFPSILRSLMIPVDYNDAIVEENEYRCQELDYMINSVQDEYFEDEQNYICLRKVDLNYSRIKAVSIRKLMMASVLCSYTRRSPIPFGSIYNERSKHISSVGLQTKYLPAVQSVGEGFLLYFDDDNIREWFDMAMLNHVFVETLDNMVRNESKNHFFTTAEESIYFWAKYILLHTLSHVLIKQLEFVCGYPATSLNERIYVSDTHHAGIMIYTVAGAEGSYGGLVTLVENNQISDLIKDSIEQARNCTSDPICYDNTSVCFSCSLLPETTCEVGNNLLNRTLLIDKDYGFFNI